MFWIIIIIFNQIIRWHNNSKIFCIAYLNIIHFAYAVSEWCTIFKCYSFISFICLSFCCIISCSINCYLSFNKYIYITIITDLNFSIKVLQLIRKFLLYVPRESSFSSTQFFVLDLDGWFDALSNKFIIFWYSLFLHIWY